MKRWNVAPSLCVALLALASRASGAERKRELPDYSSRGKDPLTVGDVAIWVPRILLSPSYSMTEYGIRWPRGTRSRQPSERMSHRPYDFFFFGPALTGSIVGPLLALACPTSHIDRSATRMRRLDIPERLRP
jgi:hypothetical protein